VSTLGCAQAASQLVGGVQPRDGALDAGGTVGQDGLPQPNEHFVHHCVQGAIAWSGRTGFVGRTHVGAVFVRVPVECAGLMATMTKVTASALYVCVIV
jgi:hypothetical protein